MAIPQAGLKLDLRADSIAQADGSAVTNWGGFAATGSATLASTGTPKGTKSVRFPASSTYFTLGNLMSGATAGDVFIVLKKGLADRSLWQMGTSSELQHYPYNNQIYETFALNNARIGPISAASGISFTDWHIYNVSHGQESGDAEGTYRYRMRQGDADTPLTQLHTQTGTSSGLAFPTTMLLGGTVNSSWYWTGDIAAFIIYDRVLTDSERTQVFNDLKTAHLVPPPALSFEQRSNSGTGTGTFTLSRALTADEVIIVDWSIISAGNRSLENISGAATTWTLVAYTKSGGTGLGSSQQTTWIGKTTNGGTTLNLTTSFGVAGAMRIQVWSGLTGTVVSKIIRADRLNGNDGPNFQTKELLPNTGNLVLALASFGSYTHTSETVIPSTDWTTYTALDSSWAWSRQGTQTMHERTKFSNDTYIHSNVWTSHFLELQATDRPSTALQIFDTTRDNQGQIYSNMPQLPPQNVEGQIYSFVPLVPSKNSEGQIYSNIALPIKPNKIALKEVILRDSPKEYWEFEESSTATQFVSTINGSVLQERGNITSAVAGYDVASNAVANFSASNYLDWPTQPDIVGAHTVECLFYATSLSGSGMGLFGTRGSADYSTGVYIRTSDAALVVDYGNGTAWLANVVVTNATIVASGWAFNKWHHLGVVAKTTGYEIYFNGRQVASGSWTGTPVLSNATHAFRVGQIGSLYTSAYNGSGATIDELAIYDKALAATRFSVRNDTDLATAENAQFSGFTGWGNPI